MFLERQLDGITGNDELGQAFKKKLYPAVLYTLICAKKLVNIF